MGTSGDVQLLLGLGIIVLCVMLGLLILETILEVWQALRKK